MENASSRRVATIHAATVTLVVYDLLGRRVRTLVDEEHLNPGPHALSWNGRDDQGQRVGAGIYFLKLSTGDRARALRMTLLP